VVFGEELLAKKGLFILLKQDVVAKKEWFTSPTSLRNVKI